MKHEGIKIDLSITNVDEQIEKLTQVRDLLLEINSLIESINEKC